MTKKIEVTELTKQITVNAETKRYVEPLILKEE